MAKERLKSKNRIWELDFIRGLCVLLMIFDHVLYDIADIFGRPWYQAAKEAGKGSATFLYNLWQAAKGQQNLRSGAFCLKDRLLEPL